MSLNLPPIERKPQVAVKQDQSWQQNFGVGWHFTPRDINSFQTMKLDAEDIKVITSNITHKPAKFNLVQYISAARIAGIPSKDFPLIAQSGVLDNPPDITQLRRYINALPGQPLLAMLALKVKLTPEELRSMKDDSELTVENLRAMLDLAGK